MDGSFATGGIVGVIGIYLIGMTVEGSLVTTALIGPGVALVVGVIGVALISVVTRPLTTTTAPSFPPASTPPSPASASSTLRHLSNKLLYLKFHEQFLELACLDYGSQGQIK